MKRLRPNKAMISKDKLREVVHQEVTRELAELQNTRMPLKDIRGNEVGIMNEIADRNAQTTSKGTDLGRFIRALASEGNRPAAYMLARKQFGDDSRVTKALETGSTGGGGALVSQDLFGEVTELLRPRSVVRRAGAISMDLPWGTKSVPRLASAATASYVGENQDIPASQPEFDQDEIELKKLAALVPLSNELISFSSTIASADQIVRDDLIRKMATTEDREFLIGDGNSGGPEGLATQVLAAQTTAATSDEEATLRTAVNFIQQANVPGERMAWIMSPRTFNYLYTQRADNGHLLFPELRADQPTLWGFPVHTTTAIPNNLGDGDDESQILLADFSQIVIAESMGMRVDVSMDASYLDSGSDMRSAFTRDQTIIRAIRHHALYLRHPEAVAVVDEVKWGA